MNLHGKKISAIKFPETGMTDPWIRSHHGMMGHLEFSQTYHGDHEQFWILHIDHGGKEVSRYNPRFVESIHWEQPDSASTVTTGDQNG